MSGSDRVVPEDRVVVIAVNNSDNDSCVSSEDRGTVVHGQYNKSEYLVLLKVDGGGGSDGS